MFLWPTDVCISNATKSWADYPNQADDIDAPRCRGLRYMYRSKKVYLNSVRLFMHWSVLWFNSNSDVICLGLKAKNQESCVSTLRFDRRTMTWAFIPIGSLLFGLPVDNLKSSKAGLLTSNSTNKAEVWTSIERGVDAFGRTDMWPRPFCGDD